MAALLIAEGLNSGFIVCPTRTDLNPYLQENLAARQSFQLVARFRADTFEFFAAFADDHAFMTIAFNHDGGRNLAQVI